MPPAPVPANVTLSAPNDRRERILLNACYHYIRRLEPRGKAASATDLLYKTLSFRASIRAPWDPPEELQVETEGTWTDPATRQIRRVSTAEELREREELWMRVMGAEKKRHAAAVRQRERREVNRTLQGPQDQEGPA